MFLAIILIQIEKFGEYKECAMIFYPNDLNLSWVYFADSDFVASYWMFNLVIKTKAVNFWNNVPAAKQQLLKIQDYNNVLSTSNSYWTIDGMSYQLHNK